MAIFNRLVDYQDYLDELENTLGLHDWLVVSDGDDFVVKDIYVQGRLLTLIKNYVTYKDVCKQLDDPNFLTVTLKKTALNPDVVKKASHHIAMEIPVTLNDNEISLRLPRFPERILVDPTKKYIWVKGLIDAEIIEYKDGNWSLRTFIPSDDIVRPIQLTYFDNFIQLSEKAFHHLKDEHNL